MAKLLPEDGNEDASARLAKRYLEQYPWADFESVQINMRVFEAEAALRQALARFISPFGYGLGAPRFLVVRALYMADGRRLSLGEIARAIRVTSTNVTSLIDGLERDGWVVRVANSHDRRVTFAQLTPEGEEKCTVLIPAVARFVAEMFAPLSQEEKRELNRLLARLRLLAEGMAQRE